MIPSYERKFRGQSPFYEIWFGKFNFDEKKALWFRYSILNGVQKEAAVWGLFFDEDHVYAGKNSFPLESLSLQKKDVFSLKKDFLSETIAVGQAGPLDWKLEWKDSGRRFSHGPSLFKKLGLTRSRYESCFLDIQFSGRVRLSTDKDPLTYKIENAPGMISHIWGSRQAHHWAWVHCNHFQNTPDAVFEGVAAHLQIGKKVTGPLSSFVLYLDGERYDFSSLGIAFCSPSNSDGKKWRFSLKKGSLQLSGEAKLPQKVAVVKYTDTDGSSLFCHNSKMASLKLTFIDTRRGIHRTLETKNTAAFEIVNRENPGALTL